MARDEAEVAETTQTEPEMAGDDPGDGVETEGEGEEGAETALETEATGTAAEPGDAQTDQPERETVTASEAPAGPTLDTDAALALRRLRERPRCCCGCGQLLSSAKKHLIQGHDGKAKVIVRKIMRGELQPQEAPTELILRHMEIKFIVCSPEFRRVVEMWREICGMARAAGNEAARGETN